MRNKQSTPEIRFGEHSENWKKRKIAELFYSVSDKNHPELPLLSASQAKGMVYRDDIGINITYDEKSLNNYKRVLPGQFVMHLRSFQGGFAYSSIEGITSPAYTVLDFKEKSTQSSLFWKYVFTSTTLIKRLETITYGIRDGRSISFRDFSTLNFLVPSKDEQQKIGNFFKQIDNLISLRQQELTALKQTKQGFLQKMFPKEGESVPEVRFSGFSNKWKERKFSKIMSRVSEQSSSPILPKVEFADIVSGEGRLNKDVSKKFDDRKGIVFEPEFILYGKLRPYLKNWLFPEFKGVALGDFWVFKSINSFPRFNYYLIQTERYQAVANLSSGTKMPRSSWRDVSVTTFKIPSLEEQEKIGNFFKQLDDTIALHEQELELLQETKKAFLQKMFV